jgi:hypothetical protein
MQFTPDDERRLALFAALGVLTDYDAFAPDDTEVWSLLVGAIRAVHHADADELTVLDTAHSAFQERAYRLGALVRSLERFTIIDPAHSPLKRAFLACDIAARATSAPTTFDLAGILAQRAQLRPPLGVTT